MHIPRVFRLAFRSIWVSQRSIKSRADEYYIIFKLIAWHINIFSNATTYSLSPKPRAWPQDVQIGTKRLFLFVANFFCKSGAWVEFPTIGTMETNIKDRAIVVKYILSAIAMVYIPIDDEDLFCIFFSLKKQTCPSSSSCNSNAIE